MKILSVFFTIFVLLMAGNSMAASEWYSFSASSVMEIKYRLSNDGRGIQWAATNRFSENLRVGTVDIHYACGSIGTTKKHYIAKMAKPGQTVSVTGFDRPCDKAKVERFGLVKLEFRQPGSDYRLNTFQCEDGGYVNLVVNISKANVFKATRIDGSVLSVGPRSKDKNGKKIKPRVFEEDIVAAICNKPQKDLSLSSKFFKALKGFVDTKEKKCRTEKKECGVMDKNKESSTGSKG